MAGQAGSRSGVYRASGPDGRLHAFERHTALARRHVFWHGAAQRLSGASVLWHRRLVSDDGAEAGALGCTFASGEPCVNIFVGNLAFTTTEQDLRQLFEPYGTVETIRIMTDRETGRSRGFGFVEMPDSHAAERAIDALNGTPLAGRTLTVNEARPREPRREPRQPRW